MAASGKEVVILTGCGSPTGMGQAMVLEFLRSDCIVVATARSLHSLSDLPDDENLLKLELDVSDQSSIDIAVRTVMEKFNRIDILVNNAAFVSLGPVLEISIPVVEKSFQVNVIGPLALVHAVVPSMMSRKHGKIINIGSAANWCAFPWTGPYCSTKFALRGISDLLRNELRPFGIQVTLVCPGAINTGLVRKSMMSEEKEYKYYDAYKKFFSGAESALDKNGTSPKDFAKKTVAVILKKKIPAYFNVGFWISAAVLMQYLPTWLTDFVLSLNLGLRSIPLKKEDSKVE